MLSLSISSCSSSSLLSSNPLISYSYSKITTKKSPTKTIILLSTQEPSKPTSNTPTTPTIIKAPTPPWFTSPLLLPHDQLLNLSHPKPKPTHQKPQHNAYKSLTGKIKGGRGRQAMKQIVHGIKKLRQTQCGEDQEEDEEAQVEVRETGDVPWAKAEERMVFRREKEARAATKAERELEGEVLERLRVEAKGLRKWVKAKKAGVTREVVDEILRGWREEDLVMVKLVDPLRRNMDRAREIVEFKTGGLVVWSKKDTLVVYRGNFQSTPKPLRSTVNSVSSDKITNDTIVQKHVELGYSHITNTGCVLHEKEGSINGSLYEREANRLLDGLGPRFIDWWWKKPLPVDADLFPEVVPEFKPPFRLCPPQERPKLRDEELTYLRKLAMHLPTHFANITVSFMLNCWNPFTFAALPI